MQNLQDEDFSSDSDDEDYVPIASGLGSEEENSGEDEDLLFEEENCRKEGDEDEGGSTKPNKRKKMAKNFKKKSTTKKKCTEDASQREVEEEQTIKSKSKEEEKKKSDDLWADFLKDVGGGPTKKISNQKVTVVKEYNFAGETVKVATEVDANSKEAKIFSSSTTTTSTNSSTSTSIAASTKTITSTTPTASTTTTTASTTTTTSSTTTTMPVLESPNSGIKRSTGGLTSLLENLQKKPKMSVLDKSKLDWMGFKREEGINDELQQHNRGKNGYLDKVAFLQRADLRQYEIERDLRMGSSSSSRKPSL